MGREYATEDRTGRRFLARIVCDHYECGRSVIPSSTEDGWSKHGQDSGPGSDKLEQYYCPEHSG